MPGDSTSATRLSPTQQALLEARLKRGRKAEGPSKALGSIPRGPEDGPAPCSFAQERFWLIHQFDPGGAADHQPRAYRLTGPLDVTVLTQALADLSLRHDVLRTVYDPPGPAGGPPSQRILPELDLRPERVDLTVFPADERLGRAVDLARALARRPFDLVRGPLTRVLLARLGIEEHLLLLDLHHSLCDGWSAGVLLRDLAALYDSAARGMPSRLAPLPIRYADYARWQRAQAATEGASRNLRGWLEALEGAPQILELPTDRPRPTAPTDHGVRATLSLGPPLSEAIDGLSRAEGATSFMTLLAGFAVMAHRFSGENDLLVGAPVAGRSRPETEGLVGAFMNILPLRLRPEPELSFRALLRQIRATTLAAVGREDLPFERLVEALRPSREPGRSPLTQVEFQLRNLPDSASKTGDLTWEEFDVDFGIARFDLSFTAVNTPLGYDLHLVAMADLYDQETAARMLGHYRTLLTAAVAAPERTIGELPLLTRAERIEAVEGRNATTMDLPFETCVHRLFEAQVARSPDAIAVTAADVDGDGSLTPTTLTYAELNRRANRLAHHLRDLGAVPESLVLVVLEQSPETLVAVLGILKSGAAYLPIEPETPAARLRALAEDARPVVVVTRPELVAELAFLGVPVVALSDAENDPAGPDANPQPVDRPNDLIYVLYTSGSTGMPKGVMLEHRAICNHLLGLQRLLPAGPTDRVALTMPLTFDPSVWELYRPLVVGARVVVAKQGGHRDPEYLARLFAAEGVTEAHFVPSMLGPFLDVGGVDQCDAIRRVICVGEALTADLRDRFFARFGPERELDNAYGPTEAAVSVTHHRCRPDEGPGPVPIGRPQANVTVHVLDDRLEPQPIGVPGELYLGGVCVARGYLNAPELTAARFVPDPFSKDSRARLYRTGDRGRVRADGAIEYLDRLDRQFKLRGIRMEPGEVEAALRRHSGVADVVVTALEDGAGNDRLVAYVVPTGTEPIDAPRLRSFLKDDLPAHLIPSAYVTLPKLPLTATGKLDRRALPRPEVTD
ncbi:MAG: amino acid adenylation domain-containing protein, partial [Isosphaeraceae bacterium]